MLKFLFAGVLVVGTGLAWTGSAYGWGLTPMLREPVSIRQESAKRRTHGVGFLYFGHVGRRHTGGGYRGGK